MQAYFLNLRQQERLLARSRARIVQQTFRVSSVPFPVRGYGIAMKQKLKTHLYRSV